METHRLRAFEAAGITEIALQWTDYTALALALIRLVDNGHVGELSTQGVNEGIRRRTLFSDLQDRYGNELDLRLYNEAGLQRIITHLQKLLSTCLGDRRANPFR